MKKFIILMLSVQAIWAQQPTKRIEFEAPESYPEGVAFDKASNAFYVTSARLGTVGKVTREGKYTELYADKSLKSTYGIKVHPDGKRLFFCAADANYSKFSTPETKKKMARLVSIDIKSGKKLSDTDLSGLAAGEHFPNDLAFDKQGSVYVTDSYADVIYKADTNGKAAVFSRSELLKSAGVGPNGIVFHPQGFLIVANNGTGALVKIELNNPEKGTKVKIDQFFPSADGLLLDDNNTLTLVQNGGVNKIFKLITADNWTTAQVAESTSVEDRFAFPSTAATTGSETWIMNANFSELTEGNNVPSKKFSLQQAVFSPAKK
ncbi:SMP-30/gluconolactonase/LRE family protein [Flavobacterium sp. DG2-3]|uniref:SMP-30/gluconolactonase/LRE family protein n=1 Tax=Flavobacterium sp. DG2-3 TaxID=3068317 RepID=UPI00273DE5B9|nr:SMP-30/gluconolactonase/LRE family protein [Flavobacterium sp. DG2-3]MDP5200320.1 SMP-30/gluconolactonase/LRE family protein [Flavobacterium sp. DG2-3]